MNLRRRLAYWIDPSLDYRTRPGQYKDPKSGFMWSSYTEYLVAQERDRIERHMPDCYGPPRSCQSCGCNRQGRFDWPKGPCRSHAYIVAWAKNPIV